MHILMCSPRPVGCGFMENSEHFNSFGLRLQCPSCLGMKILFISQENLKSVYEEFLKSLPEEYLEFNSGKSIEALFEKAEKKIVEYENLNKNISIKFPLDFDGLVQKLKQQGFQVLVKNDSYEDHKYRAATVRGKNIIGCFCCENFNLRSASYMRKRFVADHVECFDKLNKCPIMLPFPESEEQFQYLFNELDFLGTDEGLEFSDNYELKCKNDYPEDL